LRRAGAADLLHPGQIDLQILAIGLFTIAVVLLVERTPAKDFSFLVGLVLAALVAALLGWDVPTVRSLGEIPRALPTPTMPSLSLVGSMAVPAVSIALVGLIQSAGVSKGTPNRDGTYPDDLEGILRMNVRGPGRFADLLAAYLHLPLSAKREVALTVGV